MAQQVLKQEVTVLYAPLLFTNLGAGYVQRLVGRVMLLCVPFRSSGSAYPMAQTLLSKFEPVRREGIEPPTVGLRVRRSTAELAARTESALVPGQVDYRLPRSRGAASLFRPGRLDSRRVMPVAVARRLIIPAADAVPRLAMWRCGESNPVGNACKARPLPQLLIPNAAADTPQRLPAGSAACRVMLTLWRCQGSSTCTRRWCSQGRSESNADSAGFGDRLPSRWVIPM
jgi:hypothetical protein